MFGIRVERSHRGNFHLYITSSFSLSCSELRYFCKNLLQSCTKDVTCVKYIHAAQLRVCNFSAAPATLTVPHFAAVLWFASACLLKVKVTELLQLNLSFFFFKCFMRNLFISVSHQRATWWFSNSDCRTCYKPAKCSSSGSTVFSWCCLPKST